MSKDTESHGSTRDRTGGIGRAGIPPCGKCAAPPARSVTPNAASRCWTTGAQRASTSLSCRRSGASEGADVAGVGDARPGDGGGHAVHVVPRDLPGLLGRFDIVTCLDVLEHLDDDIDGLRTIGALLVPGGQAVVTVPAYAWLWSGEDEISAHRRRYTRAALLAASRAAGLEVLYASYFNITLVPAMAAVVWTRRLLHAGWRAESNLTAIRAGSAGSRGRRPGWRPAGSATSGARCPPVRASSAASAVGRRRENEGRRALARRLPRVRRPGARRRGAGGGDRLHAVGLGRLRAARRRIRTAPRRLPRGAGGGRGQLVHGRAAPRAAGAGLAAGRRGDHDAR